MLLKNSSILNIFTELKPREDWSFRDVGRSQTTAFTHDYHRYPAKFIPQIVNKLIEEYAPGNNQIVLDPFGGCGTTLVESKLHGRKSIGFDINPVAKLITDTKTNPIDPKLLTIAKEKFIATYKKTKLGKGLSHNERVYYWFEKGMVRRLDRIYLSILSIDNKDTRRFFLCSFSHILKNCSRWLMKSIKPTIDKKKVFPNAQEIFLKHLNSMIKKNEVFFNELKNKGNLKVSAKMYIQDSTKRSNLSNNSIDLIVTSPPYVTSYEYADLHQLSLLWFGDDKINFKNWNGHGDEFKYFRKKFIGSAYKTTDYRDFGSNIAEEIVNNMEVKDRPLSKSIAGYFVDMKHAFTEMYRVLKPGKQICLIIGNTEINGIPILNAEVATEQLYKIGFRHFDFIKREVLSKMITPWRDKRTGKFTNKSNPDKKRAYQYEYVVIMKKF